MTVSFIFLSLFFPTLSCFLVFESILVEVVPEVIDGPTVVFRYVVLRHVVIHSVLYGVLSLVVPKALREVKGDSSLKHSEDDEEDEERDRRPVTSREFHF